MSKNEIKELIAKLLAAKDEASREELLSDYELRRPARFHEYRNRQEDMLTLHFKEHLDFVVYGDIHSAEAEGSYCTIYLKDKRKLMISDNLGWLEEKLHGRGFQRISRDHLVNLLEVKQSSTHYTELQLKNGLKLAIDKKYREDFKRQMEGDELNNATGSDLPQTETPPPQTQTPPP